MGYRKRNKLFSVFLVLLSFLLIPSGALAFTGSGSGTAGDPYIVMTADQLNEVRDDLDAAYRLGADIDMDVSPYNEGQGWIAIGDSVHPFIGVFDGNRYIIRNLFTTGGSYDYIGLFGVLGDQDDLAEPFLVRNLLLAGVDVDSPNYSGGLAGMSFAGTVENCGVIGSVSGWSNVGGLIGLVGAKTAIRRCFSKGSVQGFDFVGGLAGAIYADASILNSYSRADVEATSTVCGGLIGYGTQLSVGDSYAAGMVTGPDSYRGGLIGKVGDDVTVVDSYYDEEVSGQDDTGYGEPRSTSEMKTRSTFSGWDFDVVWAMDAAENDGYPYLQWEEDAGGGSSSGCSTGILDPLFLLLLAPLGLLLRKSG